jgi:hypothetical protein
MQSVPERYRCCAPAGPKLRAVAYSLQEVPRWERPACAQGLAPHRGNLLPNRVRFVAQFIAALLGFRGVERRERVAVAWGF